MFVQYNNFVYITMQKICQQKAGNILQIAQTDISDW